MSNPSVESPAAGRPGTRPPAWLVALAAPVTAICAIPLVYLAVRAFSGGPAALERWLFRSRTLELTGRTLLLTAVVVVGCLLLGTATAWAITRISLPASRLWPVLAALPLAVPSYVSAFAWLATWPAINGLAPLALIMILACTPYVTLPVAAALRMSDARIDDVARLLGAGRRRLFTTVTLPHIAPAAAVGGLLAALYTIADFGAPAMLRYQVLTYAIRASYLVSFDRQAAAALAVVLVLIAVVLTMAERQARRGVAGRQVAVRARRPGLRRVSRPQTALVAAGLSLVAAASVALPLVALLRRLWLGTGSDPDWGRLLASSASTLGLGVGAALVTAVLALPLAALVAHYPGRLAGALEGVAYLGHGLPGIVVGLSLVFFTLAVTPALYQTALALIFAYTVLFLPKSLGASRSALQAVSPGLAPVARTLGRSRPVAFVSVTARLAWPGIAAGALLVMVTAMKELPATLMLRPIGSNTLATELWDRTAVARYGAAAPYAVALVVVAALPAWLLSDRSGRAEP